MWPVLLAQPYCGFHPGWRLGYIWHKRWLHCPLVDITTSTGPVAVVGRDEAWLVHEFKEVQCGFREARLQRIRPGCHYHARQTCGLLEVGQDLDGYCCFGAGDTLEVMEKDERCIRVAVRSVRKYMVVDCQRAAFESLVNNFNITEIE